MKHLSMVLALACGLAACTDDIITDSTYVYPERTSKGEDAASSIVVMTRNMYHGADVDRIIAEPDPNQIPLRVAEEWARFEATDYPGRARAMAAEIVKNRPHLVGLQEVTTFRLQYPADFQLNATDVHTDFLAILMTEIEALGGDYRVVGVVEDTDVEMPRLNPDYSLTDVRFTDHDAVLARGDVEVGNVVATNYQAAVPIPGITIKRGYVAVDATVKGKTYRFVNTHLEPASTFGGYFQSLQAQELIATFAGETLPLVLVGDLNAWAPTSDVYLGFLDAGYSDAWSAAEGEDAVGNTCCHSVSLDNPVANFDRRIDLVLFKNVSAMLSPGTGTIRADVIGDDVRDKTESGVWPSDHGGVVARFQFASPAS